MKVFVLQVENHLSMNNSVIGVVNKPKDIRKYVDKCLDIKSKGRWVKKDEARYLILNTITFVAEEFKVQGKKYEE